MLPAPTPAGTAKPAPESKSATDTQLKEVLASCLFGESQPEFVSGDDILASWQNGAESRIEFREKAKSLLVALAGCGVSLRASDSKKVLKRLEFLQTVPARVAYTELEEGLPASDAVTPQD